MRNGFTKAIAVAALILMPAVTQAEEIWVVTTGNYLINFDSATPATTTTRLVTGLNSPAEQIVGIDVRPAPPLGRLYALTNVGQLYRFDNPPSGVATPVGPGGIALTGTEFGFDFNPVVDRIRVVGNAEQNLRLHPDTGVLVLADGTIAYAAADANAGANPAATGAAYTNTFTGAVSTVLYDIDSDLDILTTQNPPNAGTLNTIGPLGVNVSAINGFDVSGSSGIAYAAFNDGAPPSTLYTININTGAATGVGIIGCNEPVRGLSVNNNVPTDTRKSTWGTIKSLYR